MQILRYFAYITLLGGSSGTGSAKTGFCHSVSKLGPPGGTARSETDRQKTGYSGVLSDYAGSAACLILRRLKQ